MPPALAEKLFFLGFKVGMEGVGTDPDKIAVIRDWSRLSNLRQNRAFVGICQYCRQFVPGFSDVSAPLHALTRKVPAFCKRKSVRQLSTPL